MKVIVEVRNASWTSTIKKNVKVATIAEARAAFVKARDDEAMGSNDYNYRCSGEVHDNSGIVAYVSYNGRVWTDKTCSVELAY